MLNSKILKAAAFCAVVMIFTLIFNYLLVPFSSVDVHFAEFHYAEKEGNIDVLITGSSLETNGLRADVIKTETGLHTCNFAPHGGFPETSYLLLLDSTIRNDIKIAVVGWDILQNMKVPQYTYPNREEIYRNLFCDIKDDKDLRNLVVKGIAEQRFTYSFFKFASFPENIKCLKEVRESWKKELFSEDSDSLPESINIDELKSSDKYDFYDVVGKTYTDTIYKEDKLYFKKMRDLCSAKGIKLYAISCPLPECVISELPNLEKMRNAAKAMFKELGIYYIDGFDQNVFENSLQNENFSDCYGHLIPPYNIEYSKTVSKIICSSN